MNSLRGKVLALTGAGGGIGRALALGLAGEGATLLLCDIHVDNLAETSAQLARAPHITSVLDVADRKALAKWIADGLGRFGQLDGIINNAGITTFAPFAKLEAEEFDRILSINLGAVIEGCRLALPHMRGEIGWIVNVSSVLGLIGCPTQSAYTTPKFAVRGFSETLHVELAMTHPHVRVICVFPGGVKTGMARNAKYIRGISEGATAESTVAEFEAMSRTTAESAARAIVFGMMHDHRRVLVGLDAYCVDILTRWLPTSYPKFLRWMFVSKFKI